MPKALPWHDSLRLCQRSLQRSTLPPMNIMSEASCFHDPVTIIDVRHKASVISPDSTSSPHHFVIMNIVLLYFICYQHNDESLQLCYTCFLHAQIIIGLSCSVICNGQMATFLMCLKTSLKSCKHIYIIVEIWSCCGVITRYEGP